MEKFRKLENFEEKKYHQIFVRILITIVEIKEKNYHQISKKYEREDNLEKSGNRKNLKKKNIIKSLIIMKEKMIWKNSETGKICRNKISWNIQGGPYLLAQSNS